MPATEPLRAQTLSISEVSARTGLSPDTLRYYKKAGLLLPVGRTSSGQRRYAADDLEWLAFLMRLRETGMSIADMQRYAQLRARGDVSLAERHALLREHRARLHERIRALRASGRALDRRCASDVAEPGSSFSLRDVESLGQRGHQPRRPRDRRREHR